MEGTKIKTWSVISRTRRVIRTVLFGLSALIWFIELLYLLFARVSPALPVNWPIFLFGAAAIQIMFLPALVLTFPRDPLAPRRILIASWLIVTSIFWVFSPLYEYLALQGANRIGILTLMTNYVWEVPIIGGLVIMPLYHYFLRLANRTTSRLPRNSALTELRKRLAFFPLTAGLLIIGLAALGLIVGLSITQIQLKPSPREIVKNIIDVMTMGFLAGILFFFVLGSLIRPWLEQAKAVRDDRHRAC